MTECRNVAASKVPSVSRASSGATSTDTKPSSPSDSSYTGRRIDRASSMSVVTSFQYDSSTDVPWSTSSRNCSS